MEIDKKAKSIESEIGEIGEIGRHLPGRPKH